MLSYPKHYTISYAYKTYIDFIIFLIHKIKFLLKFFCPAYEEDMVGAYKEDTLEAINYHQPLVVVVR